MTLIIFSLITAYLPSGHAQENDFTDDELKENDDILYFVNAGDPNPDEVSDTDTMGLFSSKTEQEYGKDDITGKMRSEEHTSELQSRGHLVCRLLLEKKNTKT